MSGQAKGKLDALRRRADWLQSRIDARLGDGWKANDLDYDRAEVSALRWAIDQLSGAPDRSAELHGVDFAIIAARHGDDCDCGDPTARQVAAYPASAARVVVRSNGRAQLVVDFHPGQEFVEANGGSYKEALASLAADEVWQPDSDEDTPRVAAGGR